jgi:hypothetical protein
MDTHDRYLRHQPCTDYGHAQDLTAGIIIMQCPSMADRRKTRQENTEPAIGAYGRLPGAAWIVVAHLLWISDHAAADLHAAARVATAVWPLDRASVAAAASAARVGTARVARCAAAVVVGGGGERESR